MKSTKIFSLLSLTLILISLHANAQISPKIVKYDATAAQGVCLPELNEDSKYVLEKSNIKAYDKEGHLIADSSDPKLISLARVVSAVNTLSSGEITAHHNMRVDYNKSPGDFSRVSHDGIQLNGSLQNIKAFGSLPSDGGLENSALIASMIARKIGNSKIYTKYNQQVSPKCAVSSFAVRKTEFEKRRNEFAEVFAAYITNPTLLKNQGLGCEKAEKFMAELLGENNIEVMTCLTRKTALIEAYKKQSLEIRVASKNRSVQSQDDQDDLESSESDTIQGE